MLKDYLNRQKGRVVFQLAMHALLALSLFSQPVFAQSVSTSLAQGQKSAGEVASKMELAKTIGAVVELLQNLWSLNVSAEERLAVYGKIPKDILDVSAGLENAQRKVINTADATIALEMIYLVTLGERLTNSRERLWTKYRGQKAVRGLMMNALDAWWTGVESGVKPQTIEPGVNPIEIAALDAHERLLNLSEALSSSLTESERALFKKRQRDWFKKNRELLKQEKRVIGEKRLYYEHQTIFKGRWVHYRGALFQATAAAALGVPTLTEGVLGSGTPDAIFPLTFLACLTVFVDRTGAMALARIRGSLAFRPEYESARAAFEKRAHALDGFFGESPGPDMERGYHAVECARGTSGVGAQ